VGFQENAVHAGRHARSRQRLNKLRLASARVSLSGRKLHGMRYIKYHRVTGSLHDREGAHVHDKILVSK